VSFPDQPTNQPVHRSVNTIYQGIFIIFAYYGELPEITPQPRGESVFTDDETGIIYEANAPTRFGTEFVVERNGALLEQTSKHMSMRKYEAYSFSLKADTAYRLAAGKLKFAIPQGYTGRYCTLSIVTTDDKYIVPKKQKLEDDYILFNYDPVYNKAVFVISQPPYGDLTRDDRVDVEDILLLRDLIFKEATLTRYHLWAVGLEVGDRLSIDTIIDVRNVIFGT